MKKKLLQGFVTFVVIVFVLWLQKILEIQENSRNATSSKKEIIAELKLNFMSFKSFTKDLSDYDKMLDSIVSDRVINRKKPIDSTHYKDLFRSMYLQAYFCKCDQFTFQNTAYTTAHKKGVLQYFDIDLIKDLEKVYAYQKNNCAARDALLDVLQNQIELIETHSYLNFLDLNLQLSRIYLRGYHTYSIDNAFDDAFTELGTSFEELGVERFLEKPVKSF
ncbi:hypothetical protein U6A24_20365 [Aquimarina gracilis]|uniref:Uncharacterized protein n=1 Tax=Aquimarina gracilis TaxID=874422 RepID=A0ABU6A130_9FLAO|nr:hypothetical protein [Aquimarina gracilis]MEB3347843.1 hypothetical protein [Aquimarina gracilis]